MLRDSGAVVALADEKLAPTARAAGVPVVLEVGPQWDAALASAPTGGPPTVEVGEDDVGLIMYTGGTTGRQKGVVHTQRGLAVNLLAHLVEMGLGDDERLLITAPLPHSAPVLRASAARNEKSYMLAAVPVRWAAWSTTSSAWLTTVAPLSYSFRDQRTRASWPSAASRAGRAARSARTALARHTIHRRIAMPLRDPQRTYGVVRSMSEAAWKV